MDIFNYVYKIALISLIAMGMQSCSSDKDNNENSETNKLIVKLTQGCFYDDSDEDVVLRFFSDNTLLFTKYNETNYSSNYEVYQGQWRIENEKDVVIQWDDDTWGLPSSAPEFILNPTFISGKMSFIDHKNKNRMFTNTYPTSLVRETLINKYLRAGHAIKYRNQSLRARNTLRLFPYNKQDAQNEHLLTQNFSLLVWEGRGRAEWISEVTYAETGEPYGTYKADCFYLLNLSENSIFFTTWYYENGEGTDIELFTPPHAMTDLKTEKNDNGEMIVFFENGYYHYNGTNFVVKNE